MAELTDIEKKIIRQIEYYFGDINLPRDRFLQDQIKQDDGWVTLETMTKFNRLKKICNDASVIAQAMKKSTSGLMEISEDDTKIRRSPDKPMPENTEERRQDVTARTVYAKPFPLDVTLDDMMNFFETHGQMESVYMRKDEKKKFKGSVFATFKSKEDFDKFIAAESVKYKDTEIESRKSKTDYFKEKGEERKQKKEERQMKGKQAQVRQEEDQKQKIKNELIKGALLHINGLSEDTKIEDIKNFLMDYGQLAWVDLPKDSPQAWVRYEEENLAVQVLAKVKEAMPDGIVLNGNKLECRVLEGEEESEKWVNMYKEMLERRMEARNKYKRDKKPQNKKGRYGKRPSKHRREAAKAAAAAAKQEDGEGEEEEGSDEEGPPEKKPKSEEPKAEGAGGDSEEPPEKKTKTDEAEVAANGD